MKKHQIADQLRKPICEYSNFALYFLEIVCNLELQGCVIHE